MVYRQLDGWTRREGTERNGSTCAQLIDDAMPAIRPRTDINVNDFLNVSFGVCPSTVDGRTDSESVKTFRKEPPVCQGLNWAQSCVDWWWKNLHIDYWNARMQLLQLTSRRRCLSLNCCSAINWNDEGSFDSLPPFHSWLTFDRKFATKVEDNWNASNPEEGD